MLVRRLQALLGNLYDVDPHYDIADFLVSDRSRLSGVHACNDARRNDEELLISETEDGADLCLFIDLPVLSRLECQDPLGRLTDSNLCDYCTALEGVSHFFYASWRLHHDAPVSLLELETQAEVDKYAVTVFLLLQQSGGRYPEHVFTRLFERTAFDARLNAEQLDRYRSAHRGAARYCRYLERHFVKRGQTRIEAMLRELRKFYRLGSAAKMEYALAAS
jgi:hypothetical protein